MVNSDLCPVQVHVVHGQYRGIRLKCIDTPGLAMSGSSLTRNQAKLHAIRKAMNKHRPDLVLYVDRNDVVRLLALSSLSGQSVTTSCQAASSTTRPSCTPSARP